MTSIITNSRERTRFLKFSVVGVIGAIVDFGVMNLLVALFGASLVIAGTISFMAAIFSNFMWNRYWTYPDSRSKPIIIQLLEFTVVSVIGMAIRIPTLALLEPVLNNFFSNLPYEISYSSLKTISYNVTLAIAVLIVLFWNFFINRYWTYGDVE
ncbi:GtrA family protein [Chloroflexota bacterium]